MLSDILRKAIAKKKEPYLFEAFNNNIDFNTIPDPIGLYIHIPFCKTICPFCPYNKAKYELNTVLAYQQALIKELSLLKEQLSVRTISSIYLGGGTPTLMIEQLDDVLNWIYKNTSFNGDIGIEVYPQEAYKSNLKQLKNLGINPYLVGNHSYGEMEIKIYLFW